MKYAHLIKGTGRVVAEDMGRESARRIMHQAGVRFEALKQENADDSKTQQSHTFKRIYPGIAMYEALRAAGVTQEKAIWYIREYFQRYCKKAAACLQAVMRLPGMAERTPGLLVSFSRNGFPESAGFKYEWPKLPENTTGFNIVRCPYFDACSRYGCPELTAVFCDSDDATYGNMHPRLIWGRTSTIGHGRTLLRFPTHAEAQTEPERALIQENRHIAELSRQKRGDRTGGR